MKVTLILKKGAKRGDTVSQATIYVRLRDGRSVDMTAPSKLTINPNQWNDKSEQVKSTIVCNEEFRSTINDGVRSLKSYIEKEYRANEEPVEKGWLKETLDKYYNPKKYLPEEPVAQSMYVTDLYSEFLRKHKVSDIRLKNYRVIDRSIKRYEIFVRKTQRGKSKFRLKIDEVTADTLAEMWDFMENEHQYHTIMPDLYKAVPQSRTPLQRGANTMNTTFTMLRVFFNWCLSNEIIAASPFKKFKLKECAYGTPIYITIEERDKIYRTNLKRHPHLAIQRDIFIFQCMIGCRVGDLLKMTKGNIIDNSIEYIPRKTKDGRPITLNILLKPTTKEILDRYKAVEGNKLLPFISAQKYNDAIKLIFLAAGLTRFVTVLNSITREEEQVRLCDIASSHLARRTFIGNLYKKVKDPNLVGALSGHKEGSKAFARYRDIDNDMKSELLDLLEQSAK
ncbi:MAG: site-specific integrase [Rikenellaceae bacterium]